MDTPKPENKPRLTSAELSQLWTGFMQDSMTVCTLKYFLATLEDAEIRPVLEYALQVSQTHIKKLSAIFQESHHPVPIGMTDQDVDLHAPKLYSDEFIINNVKQTAQMGLVMYSQALSLAERPDIQEYFSTCLNESQEIRRKAMEVLLSKGIYVRAPYITTPSQVTYVTKQSFLAGWFGEQRPLLSLEIANLYQNIQRNALGQSLMIGFEQVARSNKVRDYIKRGRKIATQHVEAFGSILRENNIPASVIWDTAVTDSTIPPFSDKLMLFQTTTMNAMGIAYYGTSMSTVMRHDIAAMYGRLMAEIGKYSEDGANLLIENGWMEEPPRMVDHEELSKK